MSFTTFHSYRLLFLTFLNRNNSFKQHVVQAHEANALLGIPLILLAVGSLFVGYLSKDMIVGLGTSFWGNSIFTLSKNVSYLEAEYLPYHIKMIPFLFSHPGIFVAYHTTSFSSSESPRYVLTASSGSANGHGKDFFKKTTRKTWTRRLTSFQKNIMFYDFHSSPGAMKIHGFLNQK